MSKKNEDNLIVGLDIGTSKVVAIAAKVSASKTLEIVGIGTHVSRGLKRGVVVNIDSTVRAMQMVIEEAEAMSGCQINSVVVGIAGSHVKSMDSQGVVAIKDGEVKAWDVEKVIEAAKAVAIPADQKIIHVIPQEFIVDGQRGIKEPAGMAAVRLEANVHLITGAVSVAQNIISCIRRCGLEVDDVVLEQLASSYAVLSEDEKNLGVCLVDIGGGTTDIAIFYDGSIKHTSVIPIAGDQVTNDIAIVLGTPTKSAECIKINYGWAKEELAANVEIRSSSAAYAYAAEDMGINVVNSDVVNTAITKNNQIEIPGIGGKETKFITPRDLAKVIEPRYAELFALIKREIDKLGLQGRLGAGVVLTGGSSKIKGVAHLGREIFAMPVRVGAPKGFKGIGEVVANPIYSTGIGLLLYSLYGKNTLSYKYTGKNAVSGGIWSKFRNWLQVNL